MQSNDWLWLPGALLALIAGGYASLAGLCLASPTRNRWLLPIGILLMLVSLLMTTVGSLLLFWGYRWGTWYNLLLPGLIGVLIIGGLLPIVYNRCRPLD